MIYLELLWSFMQIGLFSIGGGYAAMPVIQSQVVDLHHWLTLEEFADVITIAEMTPGPIAINSATFVGIQVAGIPGAIVSTLGCVIPSCIIVLTLAFFYYKYKNLRMVQGVLEGLRPAIVALIASAGLSILILSVFGNNGISWAIHQINWVSVVLFGVALFVLRKWKPSPIVVMLGCGVVGMLVYQLTPLGG